MVSALAAGVATSAELGGNDFRISDMGPDGSLTYEVGHPAVAFNPTNNLFLVVWDGDDNTGTLVDGEYEIFGQLINAADGSEVGADFRISDMGPDGNADYHAFSAAVAYNQAVNEFLVVWSGDDGTAPLVDGEFEIFGQRLDGATGAEIGTDFRISDMGPEGDPAYDAHEPAVAYSPSSRQYLVVWYADDTLVDNEFEVFGQRLDGATGTPVGSNDFRISDMGPDGDTSYSPFGPDVAFGSTANQFLVVWVSDDDTAPLVDNELEVFGQLINAVDGSEVGADFRISDMGPDGDPGYDAFRPTLAYNPIGNEFLVVWAGDDNAAPLVDDEYEVFGQRLEGSTGTPVGSNDFRLSDMGPDGDAAYSALRPTVAYSPLGNEFLVVWYGDDGTAPLVDGEFEIFGQRVDAVFGGERGQNDMRLSDMGPDGDPDYDALFPGVAYGTAGNEYLVVWEGDDDIAPLVEGEHETFGQRWALPAVAHDVGLVDPATGQWHLRDSTTGAVTAFYYGNPGDIPVMGDWDCDGTDTPGLFRSADAFAYLRNSNTQGNADIRFFFGNPSDVPLAGDFNGNNCDTLSIYRPSEQRFYIVNALGANEGGLGPADYSFVFGNPGDKPVVGDWDGDGIDEVGLHRESSGFFYWRNTLDQGNASGEIFFGDPADRFVAGDWGIVDNRATPAVFRPATASFYFRHTLTQGVADSQFPLGESPWLPVAGHFGLG
jgi:hypothetical protein